mgnify:CR=1 FL=1
MLSEEEDMARAEADAEADAQAKYEADLSAQGEYEAKQEAEFRFQIINDTIGFMSREPYYTDEKLGLKNNTIREVDLPDERFRKLAMMCELKQYGKIQISNTTFGKGSDEFIRDIQHICFWKNLVIITWRHDG